MSDFSSYTVLVSGAGSIGKRHAKNLRSLGVRNISLVDPQLTDGYTVFDKALTEVSPDVVFVCSPTKFHVEQAQKALEAGVHVFIEKPLSHSIENLTRLYKAAEGKICMVACNMRFHSGPLKIKELIESSVIGPLTSAEIHTLSYLPDWRPDQDYKQSYSADPVQGGAILDCIHEIDLALFYFGPGILQDASVILAESIGLPVDGEARLTLKHTSGLHSEVHLSFMHSGYNRGCTIQGDLGSISWEFGTEVTVRNRAGEITESFPESQNFDVNDMYVQEIRHFLECVQSNTQPVSTLTDAEAALQIALKARRRTPVLA